MRLRDKVAIITGGGSGIGRASALKFAAEGARVVVVDIQRGDAEETVKLVQAASGGAIAVSGDVTSRDDVRGMVKAAVDTYGRLDILFNNAGVFGTGTILEADEEDFDRIFAVNVKGVFLGCKEAIPVMRSQGGGAILNTASELGVVGIEGSVVYPASKGAVVQLTRCLALDHAGAGIRVNCLCPGVTDTPMIRRSREARPDGEAASRRFLDRIPLHRMARPEELANVAAFLCSDEASFITGATILSDGGWSAQ